MNLGKAKAKVTILSSLSGVDPLPDIQTVDISVSDDIKQFVQSSEGGPRDTEFAIDEVGNFGVVYPAKKYFQVPNFMEGA
jgi:hypothetical protein